MIDPTVIGEASGIEDVAQHESGHAVTRWAIGCPFLRITWPEQGRPMVEPQPGSFTTSGQNALIATCGCIADWQHRGLKIRGSQVVRLILGSANDKFEVDYASTGEVTLRPRRALAVAPDADLHRLANKAVSERWPAARCIALWRDSERFATSCRPAIDAVAATVLEHGELNYGEVSKVASMAMAGHPAPLIPEWAIDDRAWSYI